MGREGEWVEQGVGGWGVLPWWGSSAGTGSSRTASRCRSAACPSRSGTASAAAAGTAFAVHVQHTQIHTHTS